VRRSLLVAAIVIAAVGVTSPVDAGTGEPFAASISRLDRATKELMTGSSWHEGCPVGLRALRLVRLTYIGFDGEAHHGRLVVHRRWAEGIVEVFRRLYRREFPIRRLRLVDRYGADDRESMRHDNTSAFNCRYVGGTSVWSQHAYGRAIDVNPVENPYVDGSHVSPPNGEPYADRSDVRSGMIFERDLVWRAFHRIGWEWGGTWSSAQDYQHFSANGR
jgi:D-alanyl-D-alanine carboxypeptidase-like protein